MADQQPPPKMASQKMAPQKMALRLPADVVAVMRRDITGVAEQVIAAVVQEVPSYSDPFRGQMGRNIEIAVKTALEGFLDLASRREGIDAGDQIEAVLDAAYELGRGEARSGRTMDALARAYRVGARVAWREMSDLAVSAGLSATVTAHFAELVFAYIDELSDASVTGHADELATSGRLRQRRLERLAVRLLEGAPEAELIGAAERADWAPPPLLVAVVLPEDKARPVLGRLDSQTLQLSEDVPSLDIDSGLTVLLVPVTSARARTGLLRVLRDADAVVGPARPWTGVRASYRRALRAQRLSLLADTEAHLADLVRSADPDALADLRARVLAPLRDVRPASAEKLADTLAAWLRHHGRRDDIAAALYVHPQTVRYRMGQLRDLYGDRLTDPTFVRDATIALA
ncbi:MAG TPA: helix-turn-helix domain-containing protein [Marmoricola sp.]|nr:helix-turn-helix domain-containing protein [Marmoricola sp.]